VVRAFRSLPGPSRVAIVVVLVIAAAILVANAPGVLAALLVVSLVLLAVGLMLAFVGICSLPFVGFGLAVYGLVNAFRPNTPLADWAPARLVTRGHRAAQAAVNPAPGAAAGADLPPGIAAMVERVRDRAAALRSPGQSELLSPEDQQHIDRTLNEYLPNCLATYRSLPAGSADWAAGPEGETAGQLVERQLGLLEESLDRIGQRVFQAGAAQLIAQQRFLEERLRPAAESDLHL